LHWGLGWQLMGFWKGTGSQGPSPNQWVSHTLDGFIGWQHYWEVVGTGGGASLEEAGHRGHGALERCILSWAFSTVCYLAAHEVSQRARPSHAPFPDIYLASAPSNEVSQPCTGISETISPKESLLLTVLLSGTCHGVKSDGKGKTSGALF
jgi:hypothetical protein